MTRDELLEELKPLPHAARMRRMVEIGRQAATDGSVRTTLEELARGGVFERGLALQACYGSRDGEAVLRAVCDPSRLIRGLALVIAVDVCDDDQVRRAFDVLSATAPRRRLLRKLAKRRRSAAVDERLTRMLADGDPLAGTMLAYGSAKFVEEHIERAVERGVHSTGWQRLVRFHPSATAAVLCRMARAATELDGRLVAAAKSVMFALADRVPDRALELVRLLLRHVAPSELPLQRLAERRPVEMADLLMETADPPAVQFARVAHRLDMNRLRGLLTRWPQVLPIDERWFRRIPPTDRAALFRIFERGWRDQDGCLPQWPWRVCRATTGSARRGRTGARTTRDAAQPAAAVCVVRAVGRGPAAARPVHSQPRRGTARGGRRGPDRVRPIRARAACGATRVSTGPQE